ncbi:prephenate dehydratase [Bacillaceae bacterium S4-13-58]
MKQTIGYLGPKGTFTKMAVDSFFPSQTSISYESIPSCIDAVQEGKVDLGVVPLENAIEGSVHITLDYLIHQIQLPIVGEIIVPIRQHLLIHPEAQQDYKAIHTVYSHSHAIAQCHQFLHTHLPHADIEYTPSTGRGAEIVQEKGPGVAAIGNELAADSYGLSIWKPDIHDFPNNHTRFVIISKNRKQINFPNEEKITEKTTLMVTLPKDYTGALHQVLSAFAWRKMNLSKIESRPMKTGLGNYFFIIDVDQPYDDVLFPGVKAELEVLGCQVTVLGTYSSYHLHRSKRETLTEKTW